MKVKDIQDTLSNFNEKMKEKDEELGALQSAKDAQAEDLKKLKEEVESQEERIVALKERESDLIAELEEERSMRIEYPEENLEKNVIANESGFFLIEANNVDNNEGKKSESFAQKTKSKPIKEDEKENQLEEAFKVPVNTRNETKRDKMEEKEEDEEEPIKNPNCGEKRKKNLETEKDETLSCVLPQNDPTLNKKMKMSPGSEKIPS